MLVRNWMSTNVISAQEDDSIMEVAQLVREKGIRRLPVLSKKGDLVGIVSDRDIKDASPSKATTLDVHELYYLLSKLKVKEVMTKNPITISPDTTVDKAAVLMLEKKISGLPVVDEKGKMIGILTQGDVFRVLTSITGVYRGGVLFAFDLTDSSGSIKEVADVIRNAGGGMTSILSSYDNAPEGHRNVFFRVRGLSDEGVDKLVAELKEKFNYLYHVNEDTAAAR